MENGGAFASPPSQAHLSAAFHQAANSAAAAAAAAAAATNNSGGVSSAANSINHFHEALMSRMGRPFGLTTTEMKDLANNPFASLSLAAAASGRIPPPTTASAGLGVDGGFGAGAGGNAAAAFPGFMPGAPFLHHFVDPRHPFSAAFRPFLAAASLASTTTSSSSSSSSPLFVGKSSSAFQPPKSSKANSPPSLFSPGQNLFPRSSSAGSPGSPSSSPPTSHHRMHHKSDENSNRDRHGSVSPASLDSSNATDEDGRTVKKLRLSSASSAEYGCVCPICLIPLRPSELETHYAQELEFLAKSPVFTNQRPSGFKSPNSLEVGGPFGKAMHMSPRGNSVEVAPRSRWDTFQRIQRNRQSRIRVKLSRRAAKRQDEILEEEEEDTNHKSKEQQHKGDDDDIDIVGDDTKDRTSSSLGSGSEENHIVNNNNNNNNDKSGSNDHVYGPPQFTEADVLACLNEQVKTEENTDEKKEMVKNEQNHESSEEEQTKEDENHEDKDKVEVLKAKLKQLEENNKCSKCMKTLKNPVVNVGCWHIQCEKCWLLSLGTTKRCSLCGLESSPTDLRRVYL